MVSTWSAAINHILKVEYSMSGYIGTFFINADFAFTYPPRPHCLFGFDIVGVGATAASSVPVYLKHCLTLSAPCPVIFNILGVFMFTSLLGFGGSVHDYRTAPDYIILTNWPSPFTPIAI